MPIFLALNLQAFSAALVRGLKTLRGASALPRFCDSVSELHSRTNADLVVIAISPAFVQDVALQCFEFPWCVLMEKPPGLNLSQALCLQQAAHRLQRKALVALNRRFYFSTITALQDLNQRSGSRHVHVLDQQSGDFAASLGHDPAIVANWHYCCSIHLIDYLRVFGRGRASVTYRSEQKKRTRSVVVANVEFDSGDTAVYECVWSGPGPWAVMVTTPEKRWEMRPLENLCYQDAGSRTLVPVAINARDVNFKAGFRLQAEHAVAATLQQPSQSVTLDDALETMRLVSEIYQSA